MKIGRTFSLSIPLLLLCGTDLTAAATPGPVAPGEPRPIRVLLIGNSQVRKGILPQRMLEQLAASDRDGRPIEVGACVEDGQPGGNSLRTHWQAGTDPKYARGMIVGGKWDHVVLQDIYRVEEAAFRLYARRFHELIQATGAKTVLFGTASTLRDFPEGFERLHGMHLAMGRELGVPVVDASYAYFRYFGNQPSASRLESLFDPDRGHPGTWGSYLYACMIYSVITGRTPVGLAAPASIPADVALNLQNIAWAQHQETVTALKK